MHIATLKADSVRNIEVFEGLPSKGVNLICGENGSGKTSVLEAIHLLSVGRSFRTHNIRRVIREQSERLSVFGTICDELNQPVPLGIERRLSGDVQVRIAGDRAKIAESARLLPVIVMNHDAFQILSGGPKLRREFLDFGLFHVKHKFIAFWRKHQQSLRQRNAALRSCAHKSEIQSWDGALVSATEAITELRREYVGLFIPRVLSVLEELTDISNVRLTLYQGWPEKEGYQETLENNLNKDMELGYTHYGCHRADLYIKINKSPAHEFLSRGEQKLFAWAMRLTQGLLLNELQNKKPIYLLDDLPSELDQARCKLIGNQLKQTQAQLFITSIEQKPIDFLLGDNTKVFHVKHGVVSVES